MIGRRFPSLGFVSKSGLRPGFDPDEENGSRDNFEIGSEYITVGV
jgi:hypothetical protein